MRKSLALLSLFLLSASGAFAQVEITDGSIAYTQNFDTLKTVLSGDTWADNAVTDGVGLGWYWNNVTSAVTTYRALDGTANNGAPWSLGPASSTDRAMGYCNSGTAPFSTGGITVVFHNSTGVAWTTANIAFKGEQWRDAGNTGVNAAAQTMRAATQVFPTAPAASAFFDAATATAGTFPGFPAGFTAAPSLDITTPIFASNPTAGGLNGNAPANQVAISTALSVAVPAGEYLAIHWTDMNDISNDYQMGIDDFSVTFSPVPVTMSGFGVE